MRVRLHFSAVAVAALKGLDHGGDGEGKQQEPDENRNLGRFLQHFDTVSPSKMDHVEVAIEGEDDEEGYTGSSVEKQHEKHRFTNHIVTAAPQVVLIMVDLERKAGHQQKISNHNVEQEDAFVLPELEPEDEDVEDGQVERQTQRKFSYHHIGEDLVCGIIWYFAVVNC